MTPEAQRAVLAITLHAAFADGSKHERERDEVKRIAESLCNGSDIPDLGRLYQDVLLRRVTLDTHVAALTDPGHRQLAYEMAVCVCDADGRQSEAEQRFLATLKAALQLDAQEAAAFEADADSIVDVTEAAVPAAPALDTVRAAGVAASATLLQSSVPEAEIDKSILNYSLVNGALELLPQSWASMAIIPLQIKMVYAMGKAHGVSLDQGHIKEFLAAAGVGLTSQYLEQAGRKLLGGLLGKMAGKSFGKIGSAATGMAFSFATTYALGQIARRYYAGGRQMSSAVLRDSFQNLLGPAKEMQARYLPQIQQTASGLDAAKVMSLVRGA